MNVVRVRVVIHALVILSPNNVALVAATMIAESSSVRQDGKGDIYLASELANM